MPNDTGHRTDSDDDGIVVARKTGEYLVYFAAERTLMAWIRAALGLMALGFVIDRLGLVVREMAPQQGQAVRSSTLSFLAGAGVVVIGALMAVVAAVRYAQFARRYRQTGDTRPGHGLAPAVFFAIAVALAGAVIAGYLITVGL